MSSRKRQENERFWYTADTVVVAGLPTVPLKISTASPFMTIEKVFEISRTATPCQSKR